jgi:hypothetical protein
MKNVDAKIKKLEKLISEFNKAGISLDWRFNNLILINHKKFNKHFTDLSDKEQNECVLYSFTQNI